MNEEKKEDTNGGKGISILMTIGVVVAVILIGTLLFVATLDIMHNEAIDHAQDTINSMDNVSDDYRQGWNDCLDDIDDYYNKAHNTTSSVADNTI
jgi:hypothetical protein